MYIQCKVPLPKDREWTVKTDPHWTKLTYSFSSPSPPLCILIESRGFAFAGSPESLLGTGFGLKLWPEGHSYYGQLQQLQPHGIGRFAYASGVIEEGRWEAARLHGMGVRLWAASAFYHGQFRNHLAEGYGYFQDGKGHSYIGFWKKGVKSGKGVITFRGKTQLSGVFEEGSLGDLVTLRKADGSVTKGQYKKGLKTGAFLTRTPQGQVRKRIYSEGHLIL